ncbi:AI-2E family transporter [Vineibacter terrae]|uniref:AI-2E family transporter n=1 Tax=Vineibacter terrae TaxID=2586908 RepID=UPI002E336B8F|nr:AI-2E family transporter [Vineibacter terrae]HEX2891543.1 AI-2E family transporter [Vineibacter terrae]
MPAVLKPLSSSSAESTRSAASIQSVAAALLAAAVVVGFLYFGRDVLIPVALTALISFALGPLVSVLRRFVGLKAAVALSVLVAVLVVGGLTFLLAWQLTDLAANLPKYRSNLHQKIEELRGGGGVLADAVGGVRELIGELTRPQGAAGTAAPGASAPPPPPAPAAAVMDGTALDIVASFLLPVVVPLLLMGLIIVLVVFMLLEREPLRDRLIHLISRGDISRTTEAINDAVSRLSRFLAMQVLINISYGTTIAIGLWLMGMPNPLVWGLLGGVLRFVPYAGAVIGALVPTLVAFAVSPGWTLPLMTLGLIVLCEVVAGQVVEPLLYGSSTGISPLAVLISTITWAALWGPVGLLLAMPLTVCLVVIGRHVPQLAFLDILLADEPALPVEAQIYHRLLAHSPFDAIEIAVEYARESGSPALFDKVLLPLLVLAETDRRRGALDSERQSLVAEGIEEIVDTARDELDTAASDGEEAAVVSPPASNAQVLCIGGRSDLDRAAAVLTAAALIHRNIPARVHALRELAVAAAQDPAPQPSVVAFCVLLPGSATVINHLLRRLRLHGVRDVPVVIGAFGAEIGQAAGGPASPPYPIARTVSDVCDLVANAAERREKAA